MRIKHILLSLSVLLFSPNSYSQWSENINYFLETGVNFSGGEYTPFWLTANNFGLSSVKKNNGYLRAGLFRPYSKEKGFDYNLGIDLAGAYNFTSEFIIQQLFVDVRYNFLEVSIGSKERDSELKNSFLSSGGLTFSNNSRPVPQVRLAVPEYLTIPGTKELFAVKAHVAYGKFTDNNWQKDFTNREKKYSEDIYYHSKALFARIGNEEVFPLVFEGGLEMAAQFRGKIYNYPGYTPYLDMRGNFLKDCFQAFIPGGSDATDGVGNENVSGNHLGSWHFSLSYKFPEWKVRTYYEHFFEDHSMMFGEYGWKDFMGGIEVTLPQNPILNNLVYEYLITKDQSGPIYHDKSSEIPDQISGRDNYYNHSSYGAWQHWGQAVGNPLLLSPVYNKDGEITFKSNRIKAHHFGFSGQPTTEIGYRILLSHTRNWGTYDEPFVDIKKNFSFLSEIIYSPGKLPGWKFTGSFAFDRGQMIGDNTGGMITICKTGLLKKQKKL